MRFLLALLLLIHPLSAEAQSPARTVYVVRHAEKADDSRDPQLSERVHRRAEALAEALRDAGVSAVFVTQFVRTNATAAPTARAAGVEPVVLAASRSVAEHAAEIAAAVRARPAGEAVLVVGHSNTVPAIVAALGGPTMPEICEDEYANLFVLTVLDDGATRTARVRFGEAEPGCG